MLSRNAAAVWCSAMWRVGFKVQQSASLLGRRYHAVEFVETWHRTGSLFPTVGNGLLPSHFRHLRLCSNDFSVTNREHTFRLS